MGTKRLMLRLTEHETADVRAGLARLVSDVGDLTRRLPDNTPADVRAAHESEIERLLARVEEKLRRGPAPAVDLLNFCAVTAHDVDGARRVVMLRRPPSVMQPAEALQVAAWLVVGAELADSRDNAIEQVAATVDAIHEG